MYRYNFKESHTNVYIMNIYIVYIIIYIFFFLAYGLPICFSRFSNVCESLCAKVSVFLLGLPPVAVTNYFVTRPFLGGVLFLRKSGATFQKKNKDQVPKRWNIIKHHQTSEKLHLPLLFQTSPCHPAISNLPQICRIHFPCTLMPCKMACHSHGCHKNTQPQSENQW